MSRFEHFPGPPAGWRQWAYCGFFWGGAGAETAHARRGPRGRGLLRLRLAAELGGGRLCGSAAGRWGCPPPRPLRAARPLLRGPRWGLGCGRSEGGWSSGWGWTCVAKSAASTRCSASCCSASASPRCSSTGTCLRPREGRWGARELCWQRARANSSQSPREGRLRSRPDILAGDGHPPRLRSSEPLFSYHFSKFGPLSSIFPQPKYPPQFETVKAIQSLEGGRLRSCRSLRRNPSLSH